MTNKATYDDANLLLRLYELRREDLMRKARQWFFSFTPSDPEQLRKVAERGSQENAYFRMVASYWDMAASFVTSGVLNEELFLQNNGELLFIWEKSRAAIEQGRAAMKNPAYMKNFETVAQSAIQRMGPENYESWSAMVRGAAAATEK
jgi:L-rhamnose mutarotase